MRIIGHLDMDAFFAAVEERDHEWLRGLPVVVGADPEEGRGRGVVSTSNYKAREYGIRSAMPITKAWQASEEARRRGKPPAVFLGTNFERYTEVSGHIMEIMRSYSSMVEQASVDEAYFEIPITKKQSPNDAWGEAEKIAKLIKEEIRKKEGLTCSIGIGPNKLIAKIASDMHKPDGLTLVREEDAELFLEPLPIRKMPGIGPKTEAELLKKKIRTVQDLKAFSKEDLVRMLGKWGSGLYEKARGRDDMPLEEGGEAKSIGEQETFREDTLDPNFILARLKEMSASVAFRFAKEHFSGFRTVAITVRFADFETKTRAHTLARAANSFDTLHFEAIKLIMPFLDARENPGKKAIRLVGVRVEKFTPTPKSTLRMFGDEWS